MSRNGRECQAGLDSRCQDFDGEIRRKRSDTLVRSLRKTYGENFASEYRADMKLGTLLEKAGAKSLSDYLKRIR